MTLTVNLGLLANSGAGPSPPVHPMLVNFTAAVIPFSVVFDLLGAALRKDQLRAVGWWSLLAAAVITPFTALAGWVWMRSMGHDGHVQMLIHQWLGISLAVVTVALAAWRGALHRRAPKPGWAYVATSLIVLGALSLQRELGASMSFGRGIL